MENLFKNLAWKCYENGLNLDFTTSVYGISITKSDEEFNHTEISRGYIKDWEWEEPVEALERMHQEVDQFIEKEHMDDTENVYFERPRGVSSDELKMKESGHKISDFE